MPTVGYCDDADDETYAGLLFSEIIHHQIVEEVEPEQKEEVEKELDFMYHTENAPMLRRLGRDLRILSEDFAKSANRMKVLDQANNVDFNHINYETFQKFLAELFVDGINREKIVILLFFCSDVIAKAYRGHNFGFMNKMFFWFLDYIKNEICDWVKKHGGWEVVITQYVPAITKSIFYTVGTVALVAVLYKRVF